MALPFGFVAREELPGGHCSKVHANETQVLKLPFQGEEMGSGFRAGIALGTAGIGPAIFESDPKTAAILMERVTPGTPLSDQILTEEETISAWFKTVLEIRKTEFDSPIPLENYFEKTHPMLSELIDSSPNEVFLHGDLHHFNILRSNQTGYVVIDPKGLFGDPNYEAVAFFRNPLPSFGSVEEILNLTLARLEILARQTDFETERVIRWAYLDAKFNCENLEIDHPWQRYLTAFETLRPDLRTEFKHKTP